MHGKTIKFLDTAIHIANRLVNDAIWYENRCTWMGDDSELIDEEWKIVYQTVDAYLYSGNAGIARFLIFCWQETQDEALKRTAIAAITHSLYLIEQTIDEKLPLGLYDGLIGVVLVATEIENSLQNPIFHKQLKVIIDEIKMRIISNDYPNISDLLSGYAGYLVGLIKLSKMITYIDFNQECYMLSQKLLKEAHHTSYGYYWDKIEVKNVGLSGLAHGASGIAYALYEYGQLIKNKQHYLYTARQGLKYEKSWFSQKRSNWADIRSEDNKSKTYSEEQFAYPVFWCHGAGGIGLVRLRNYKLTKDKNILAEASASLYAATTEARTIVKNKKSSAYNLSVCHGMGSILDLFLYAYQVLGEDIFLKRARDIGNFNLSISKVGTEEEYWRCGIQGGGETPGLMIGLSGIGYNFLCLYKPEVYSSPVGLEIA